MSSDLSGDPALLRSYLLGTLGEDDADALETRLLHDDALFELAEAVEGDLLAAFSRGELAPNDRKQVIRRLAASPRGRDRLALAEGLTALAGQSETPAKTLRPPLPFRPRMPRAEQPTFRIAAAAAAVLVMAGGVWLALQTPPPGGTMGAARAARNQATAAVRSATTPPPARPQALPAAPAQRPAPEIARKPQTGRPSSLRSLPAAVLQLAISTTRSAEQHHSVLTIPAGTRRVEIELLLNEGSGESFKSYRAAVLDAASEAEVWSQDNLLPRAGKDGPRVVLSLPAAKLPEGMYSVDLRGLGPDGSLELVGLPSFEVRLISVQR